jgi:hypothetical protein
MMGDWEAEDRRESADGSSVRKAFGARPTGEGNDGARSYVGERTTWLAVSSRLSERRRRGEEKKTRWTWMERRAKVP